MKNLLLPLLLAMSLFNTSNVLADANPSGLREGEKKLLEKIRTTKEKDPSPPSRGTPDYQYVKQYEKEYEMCQNVLKKIDKLSLELEALKLASAIDTRQHELKIKSIASQINRYKTQAKQFCNKEVLRDSVHVK